MLSAVTGGKERITTDGALKEIIGEKATPKASADPRDADVPTIVPGKEHVNTQCTHDILPGCQYFEVHSMIGVVVGQILSIGWDTDIEHFTVAKLGSIHTVSPLKFAHKALSPIRIVRSSTAAVDASGSSGATPPGGAKRTRKSDDDSGVESVIAKRSCMQAVGKLHFRCLIRKHIKTLPDGMINYLHIL